MDRLNRRSNYENQLKPTLFRQLFHFQMELERFNKEHYEYQEKVREIIHLTDDLMEFLLMTDE